MLARACMLSERAACAGRAACSAARRLTPLLPACPGLPPFPRTSQGELDTTQRGADAAGGASAQQWVPEADMQGKGLSSGVKKVGAERAPGGVCCASRGPVCLLELPPSAASAPPGLSRTDRASCCGGGCTQV